MTFDAVTAATFLLETSGRALGAALAVALVLRALRIKAAAVRHAAWCVVLAGMLLMPVLPSIVPALPLPIRSDVPMPSGSVDRAEATVPTRADTQPTQTRPVIVTSTTPVDVVAAEQAQTLGGRPSVTLRQWLPAVLIGVYIAGALLFLGGMFHGWRSVSGMIGRATRGGALRVPSGPAIRAGSLGRVYESTEVVIPMTAGVVRSVIVLPLAWKTWTPETLAAIVAHEREHVRRRDALTALLARLNRAIFWFHPLAWWLERTLAVTAEHACDEAGVQAVAEPRRYAEILVEMAETVRRHRGRVAWQAVGVDGAGLLEGRIDRVLAGEGLRGISFMKKTAALMACGAAILLVVACRQQVTAAPPQLREDPELAKRLAAQDENVKKFEAARDMTQPQADELEQKIAANPEDFESRRQLATYYRASSTVAWDKKVPGLRRHALWLIEHHPEHEVLAPALSPQYDPEGFAAAKQLWEAHLARADASPFLIYRAVMFFAPHDKPYAEQLILRGMAMDPESAALKARMPPNVAGYQWPSQLADLYASALVGSESMWGTYNDLRTHIDKLKTPFADEVRRKLEASTDATLLSRVGARLTRPGGYSKEKDIQAAREQAKALGIRYLQRAIELDPNLETAKTSLYLATASEQQNEADRLANRAHERYIMSEDITEHVRKQPEKAQTERAEAKQQAEQVLEMAKAHAGDPSYSAAVMTAHHVLATDALREGDRERALLHLRESVKVPTSDRIKYAPPFSWMRPVNRLLKEGERDGVVQFLEAYAQLTVRERQRLLDDAKAIREGRMPSAYQHMMYRETAPSPFKPMR